MPRDTRTPRWMQRRLWILLCALAILVLAASLRLRGVQRWSLNNDEQVQVLWSSLPFDGMMKEVRRDAVHPPLDYLIQFSVGRLGGPEWVRRLPNVLFGIATVGLVMVLTAWWSSPTAGLIAGFLMSIVPMHIRYSQEVRPYSSALFFILASLAALEYYARTQRRPWAIAWAVLVFFTGSTLYFAGMLVAVASLFRIFIDRRDRTRTLWRSLPLIVVLWTLFYSPWFPVIHHLATSERPQTPDKLDWPWWSYRAQTMGAGDYGDKGVSLGSWALWIAVLGGIVASVRQRSLRIATVWLVVGGALQILVLQIHPHYSDPRYLISAWPAAFILAGAGIAALTRWRVTVPVAVTIALLFTGHAALTLNAYYHGTRSDWRSVAQYVQHRAKPGEPVILANWWVVRNFAFYFRSPPELGINLKIYEPSPELAGPAWIVTGHCFARPLLKEVPLMHSFPNSEFSEVRYLREGQRLSMREEICPEP